MEVVKPAATTAVDRAPLTQANRVKTPVTAMVLAMLAVRHDAHKPHARREKNSNARTHVARASTQVTISATILTIASQPAMFQQAFPHLACLHGVATAEVEGAEIVAAPEVETLVAAHEQAVAVAVAGEILAAGFGADKARKAAVM